MVNLSKYVIKTVTSNERYVGIHAQPKWQRMREDLLRTCDLVVHKHSGQQHAPNLINTFGYGTREPHTVPMFFLGR